MANMTWIGGSTGVQQVTQKNVASSTSGHTFIITLAYEDGTTVAVLTHVVDGVDAGNTTTIAEEIVAEFNALTHALATPITASNSTSKLILTADTAGVPFYATFSGTGTWNTTGVTDIANAGPNDWHTAANWTGGAVPGASDSVYIDNTSSYGILYGLYQNPAGTTNNSVTLTLLKIRQGHPQIGTLLSPLTYKVTTLDIGESPGDGSNPTSNSILNLKPGNVATAGTIRYTNNTGSGGKPPVQISMANASSTFMVLGTSYVGFGTAADGETCTVGTITVKDGANVVVGSGVTLTTLNPEGGSATLYTGCTTVNYGVGSVLVKGAGNITTVNAGGVFEWDSSGTITLYKGYGSSVGRFWRGTTTDVTLYSKDAFYDASVSGIAGNHTVTNGVDCSPGVPTKNVNFGDDRNVQQAAV